MIKNDTSGHIFKIAKFLKYVFLIMNNILDTGEKYFNCSFLHSLCQTNNFLENVIGAGITLVKIKEVPACGLLLEFGR